MHNIKRFPTGCRNYWPNRAEIGVRLFKKFLSALITPAQLIRKAATVRNTRVTLSGKTPVELTIGRRPRDLMDPASMNPEQLTSTQTKQDHLNEKIQNLAMKTHLEAQQREDIRRDLAAGMKFVPPELRVRRTSVLLAERSEQNSARTKIWKMVEGGNHCCQRHHGGYQ